MYVYIYDVLVLHYVHVHYVHMMYVYIYDVHVHILLSIVRQLSLSLEKGVGVSLINSVPEELIFASASGIRIEYVSTAVHHCLNATIQYIQVSRGNMYHICSNYTEMSNT